MPPVVIVADGGVKVELDRLNNRTEGRPWHRAVRLEVDGRYCYLSGDALVRFSIEMDHAIAWANRR